jgi:hypothetical protein
MNQEQAGRTLRDTLYSRRGIGVRLLYTIIYLVIFEILKFIIQITVIFQYIYLLATLKYSKPLKTFSNRLSTYAYRVMRYLTLNENLRPFPFSEFPGELEDPVEPVAFG